MRRIAHSLLGAITLLHPLLSVPRPWNLTRLWDCMLHAEAHMRRCDTVRTIWLHACTLPSTA